MGQKRVEDDEAEGSLDHREKSSVEVEGDWEEDERAKESSRKGRVEVPEERRRLGRDLPSLSEIKDQLTPYSLLRLSMMLKMATSNSGHTRRLQKRESMGIVNTEGEKHLYQSETLEWKRKRDSLSSGKSVVRTMFGAVPPVNGEPKGRIFPEKR